MKQTNKTYELWFLFASLCLSVSGILSLPIFLGKVPSLAAYLPNMAWTQWSLVVHVILALILWHIAVPVGITNFFNRENSSRVNRLSLALCGFGALMLFFAVPSEQSRPLLTNYIPMITSPVFVAGLALVLLGLLGGFLGSKVFFYRQKERRELWPLHLGVCFYIASLAVLVAALYSERSYVMGGKYSIVEYVAWGPGHIMQHLSSIYLLVSWNILLTPGVTKKLVFNKEIKPAFIFFALTLLAIPLLLQKPITDMAYRDGFTQLMRWGIFPGFIIFFVQLWRHRLKVQWKKIEGFKLIAFVFSAILLVTGFVFGAFIDGQNLKVPGHYHATIGAITISFMAMVIHFLRDRYPVYKKKVKALFWSYGIGQILFSSGLFVAGVFDVERKTYGEQLELANAGKKAGIGILGVGGSLALVGGVLFALIFFKILFNYISGKSLEVVSERSSSRDDQKTSRIAQAP